MADILQMLFLSLPPFLTWHQTKIITENQCWFSRNICCSLVLFRAYCVNSSSCFVPPRLQST